MTQIFDSLITALGLWILITATIIIKNSEKYCIDKGFKFFSFKVLLPIIWALTGIILYLIIAFFEVK